MALIRKTIESPVFQYLPYRPLTKIIIQNSSFIPVQMIPRLLHLSFGMCTITILINFTNVNYILACVQFKPISNEFWISAECGALKWNKVQDRRVKGKNKQWKHSNHWKILCNFMYTCKSAGDRRCESIEADSWILNVKEFHFREYSQFLCVCFSAPNLESRTQKKNDLDKSKAFENERERTTAKMKNLDSSWRHSYRNAQCSSLNPWTFCEEWNLTGRLLRFWLIDNSEEWEAKKPRESSPWVVRQWQMSRTTNVPIAAFHWTEPPRVSSAFLIYFVIGFALWKMHFFCYTYPWIIIDGWVNRRTCLF